MDSSRLRPVPCIGAATDVRQCFFTNILLLGFNPSVMEEKYRIPFNKDMFLLPNKKAFEAVAFFLFNKLNAVLCKEQFRDCWPVGDKKQEQQFRKTVNNWLTHIAKEEPGANLPRIVASLFLSPGGERFYQLMFAFSKFVLFKHILELGCRERDVQRQPLLSAQNQSMADVMCRCLQSSTVRHRRRLLDLVQDTVLIHQQWKKAASEMVQDYRQLTKSLRKREDDLQRESRRAMDAGFGSPVIRRTNTPDMYGQGLDTQSVKRAQKVARLREMWKDIDNYCRSKEHERKVVESILRGVVNMNKIDAGEINVKIPDMLLRECEQELHRRNVGNLYREGKLDILSLIQLWNLSLHLYIDKLHEVGVPSFDEQSASILTQVHTHHAHYTNAKELRAQLASEILPDLRQSVSTLQTRLDVTRSTPGNRKTTSFGMSLLPSTPVLSFDDESTLKVDTPDTLRSLKHRHDKVSTPEAVSHLTKSVEQSVHKPAILQGSPLYGPKQEFRGRPAGSNLLKPSKLPGPDFSYEKVGDKHRTRIRSAPQRAASFDVAFTPQKQVKAPVSRAQPARLGKESAMTTPTKIASSSSTREAREHLTEQVSKTKSVFKKPSDKTSSSVIKKSSAAVGKQKSRVAAAAKQQRSKDILAEQVANAVITGDILVSGGSSRSTSPSSGPDEVNLRDPLAGLGASAFEHRDKLARTPAEKNTLKPTWRETLLHDELSTRERVAREIFTPRDSVEENIITVGETEADISFVNASHHSCAGEGSSHYQSGRDHGGTLDASVTLDFKSDADVNKSRLHGGDQGSTFTKPDLNFTSDINNLGIDLDYDANDSHLKLDNDRVALLTDSPDVDGRKEGDRFVVPEDMSRKTPLESVRPFKRYDVFDTPSGLQVGHPISTPSRSVNRSVSARPGVMESRLKTKSPPSGFLSPRRRTVHEQPGASRVAGHDIIQGVVQELSPLKLDENEDSAVLLQNISLDFLNARTPDVDRSLQRGEVSSVSELRTCLRGGGKGHEKLKRLDNSLNVSHDQESHHRADVSFDRKDEVSASENTRVKECWVEKSDVEVKSKHDIGGFDLGNVSPPLVELKSQGTKRSKDGSDSERSITADDIISRYKKLKLNSARSEDILESEDTEHSASVNSLRDRFKDLTVGGSWNSKFLDSRFLTRSPEKGEYGKELDGEPASLPGRDGNGNIEKPSDRAPVGQERRFKLDLDALGSPAVSPPAASVPHEHTRTSDMPGRLAQSPRLSTEPGFPNRGQSHSSYIFKADGRMSKEHLPRHTNADFFKVLDSTDDFTTLDNIPGLLDLDGDDSILLANSPLSQRKRDTNRSILTSDKRRQHRSRLDFSDIEGETNGSGGDFNVDPETDTLIDI